METETAKATSKLKMCTQKMEFRCSSNECIRHAQKRVKTALRILKKETPGLGEKGKLIDTTIDKLKNYYGSNVGDLKDIKTAVHVSVFHCK